MAKKDIFEPPKPPTDEELMEWLEEQKENERAIRNVLFATIVGLIVMGFFIATLVLIIATGGGR